MKSTNLSNTYIFKDTTGLPDSYSEHRRQYPLEENYWTHVEMFPATVSQYSLTALNELRVITRARRAATSAPIHRTQPSPAWASDDLSSKLCTALWGECTSNPSFLTMAPTAMPSAQVQNYHWMPVQAGVGQANKETRGGRYIDQMPFNCAPPLGDMSVYSLPSFLPVHAAQDSYQWTTAWGSQTTPSLGACTCQSNWQAATSPQQSSARNQDPSILSSITTEPSLPASVVPLEDISLIDTSSASEDTVSKEAPLATEACPFPKCGKKCGRPQELERHIREHHLPYHIHCEQRGCNWTGYRRYALQNHLSLKHKGVPMPKLEAFVIYDARGLVKQLLNKEIDVEQAVINARILFQERAAKLGKLGIRRCMRASRGA